MNALLLPIALLVAPATQPAAPNFDTLRDLVGRDPLDPAVVAVMESLPDLELDHRVNDDDGTRATFAKSEALGITITIYAEPWRVHAVWLDANYPGDLPDGLAFGQTRREAENHIGAAASAISLPDRFEAQYLDHGLILGFTGDPPHDADATLTTLGLLAPDPDVPAALPAGGGPPRLMIDVGDAVLDESDVKSLTLVDADGRLAVELALRRPVGEVESAVMDGERLAVLPSPAASVVRLVVAEADADRWTRYDLFNRLNAAVHRAVPVE